MIGKKLWDDFHGYYREVKSVRTISRTHCSDWRVLLSEFPLWRKLQNPGRNPLEDRLPWITIGGMKYLSTLLGHTKRVFEWGSGGSTLYLVDKVGELVTIEHDPDWLKRVKAEVEAGHRNDTWTGKLELPVPYGTVSQRDESAWSDYFSSDARYADMSFESYSRVIEEYEDNSFDLVLVDGRARPSCIHHAIPKVIPGGALMLDNAERRYYGRACDELKDAGWTVKDFYGPGMYAKSFWNTQFWHKPESGGH